MMAPEQTKSGESASSASRALRWMFVNRRSGRITLAQWPNVPLTAFLVLLVVSKGLHPSGSTSTVVRGLGLGALVVWALDELLRGVNPFRRILGGAVLVTTVANLALH